MNPVTVVSNDDPNMIAGPRNGLNSCADLRDSQSPMQGSGDADMLAGLLSTHHMLVARHTAPQERTLVHPQEADVLCVREGGAYALLPVLAHHVCHRRSRRTECGQYSASQGLCTAHDAGPVLLCGGISGAEVRVSAIRTDHFLEHRRLSKAAQIRDLKADHEFQALQVEASHVRRWFYT